MANLMRKMWTSDQIKKLGGTKLYCHAVGIDGTYKTMYLITTNSKEFETMDELLQSLLTPSNLINAWIYDSDDDYSSSILSITDQKELVFMDETGSPDRRDFTLNDITDDVTPL